MTLVYKKSLIECDLTPDDDSFWGTQDAAYLKKDIVDNQEVWSIYGSQGARMGYASDRQVALALISKNELKAMSVH